MNNRDVYQKDPSLQKLINDGVANVNDDKTQEAMRVLRYELETFVCEGQYEKGLAHILDTFLKNIDQPQQPAVWVSGFYGSGKSHLVKMLRALWGDTQFSDGATARGIATLPVGIRDSLRELSAQGKRHGGLHAASGTLGASASGSVRLALLSIIFKSVGLPEQYPVARFVMWLKSEGIFDEICNQVEKAGYNWEEELDNFYVAEGLHEALVAIKPNLFAATQVCVETLNNLYPYVQDISNDEMIKAIKQALTRDGKFPLTLVVLDEVQQYIGSDSQRSIDVQEVVESCCKSFGGKLLFIGTGQTAVTGTENLKKLEGRFTIRIELSDADVDAVIRKVILPKKPEAKVPIEQIMQTNLGEISRHLAGTTIGHRQEDIDVFVQDYPLLPVRKRFWENTLRVLDQTGTDSQLRNQLSLVHKVIQTNLDAPLGHVVPADFLYFDIADRLLQSRLLPRKVHEKTFIWKESSNEDERLMARACSLIFLINKLSDKNKELGIKATVDTLTDLLVEDLHEGSGKLRSRLPGLLENCELVMKINDEYRIQTEESAVWNDDFHNEISLLANQSHRLDSERSDRIRTKYNDLVKKLTINQGASNVSREIHTTFDSQLPNDSNDKVYVWVRDGWSTDERSVQADARQAGNQSPTIFVFLPRRSADDLRKNIMDFKAASSTLNKRGVPNTAEGLDAKAAMETIRQTAEARIDELLSEIFAGARVYQGGGNEIVRTNLQEMIKGAAENALKRLYPQFAIADHAGWAKVYEKAQKGAPDALKSIGYDGEVNKHPVCKSILAYIAGGKKGVDIRSHFEGAPYGWSRDAVDGALQIMLVTGLIRAQNDHGQSLEPTAIERKNIGKVMFKVEATTISAGQRIEIRKTLQKAGVNTKPSEELSSVPTYLDIMKRLAERAGGEEPKPAPPSTDFLQEISMATGNEQLLAIYNRREELNSAFDTWTATADAIDRRWPTWIMTKKLLAHAGSLTEYNVFAAQIGSIEQQRQLLLEPDPVAPILTGLVQALRLELNRLHMEYKEAYKQGMDSLANDSNWNKLELEQREQLLAQHHLQEADEPVVEVKNNEEVLATLDRLPLKSFGDRIAALPARFNKVLEDAAKILEPEVKPLYIPRRTLKTEEEIDAWVNEVKTQLKSALAQGPIMIQ
jgi:hypothetical protein